ncbi:4Fe-4S dicluster domain-containing protein, partial [Candidatus Latescibacterota bacterium]
MTEMAAVRPDTEFIRRILDSGGGDLKQCFQCATCSVACELAEGQRRPFPRKEMIWAQWGLKDRLLADPDIWLCHQCNDCSTKCPRGARPGDVLAAVRHEAVCHYAAPGFLGNWLSHGKMLPVLLLLPALLLALALGVRDQLWASGQGVLGYLHHPGFYSDLFPHWLLIGFYSTFWGLALLGAAVGVTRFWRAMKSADLAAGREVASLGVVGSTLRTIKSILVHDKFSKCTSE